MPSQHLDGIMGAGASTLPASIDKATAKTIAGDAYDEHAFDAAAVDGVVSRDAFLAAASTSEICEGLVAQVRPLPRRRQIEPIYIDEDEVNRLTDTLDGCRADDHETLLTVLRRLSTCYMTIELFQTTIKSSLNHLRKHSTKEVSDLAQQVCDYLFRMFKGAKEDQSISSPSRWIVAVTMTTRCCLKC